jgi:pyruvate dehydrogenase E2 component (dihydrolipoamide acetyltransferase)
MPNHGDMYMIKEIKLPEISDNVDTADVISVLVKKGDTVDIDQSLIEVETDKASFDVPSTEKGIVTDVFVKENETINVGHIIVTVETGGAAEKTGTPDKKETEPVEAEPVEETEQAEPEPVSEQQPSEPVSKVPEEPVAAAPVVSGDNAPASPSVRRFARELGADINAVPGSGPGGRISQEDVTKYVKSVMIQPSSTPAVATAQPMPDFSKWGTIEREKMSTVRKITAQSMGYAWNTVPHVTQFDSAHITGLNTFIKKYGKYVEKAGGKLTVTAIILKVVASALKVFPHFNASIDVHSQELIIKKYCHIGLAVDTERGLLVPIIRDVDKKSIKELSLELIDIADRARNKKIGPADLEGGTFTISNQGSIGGTNFTPIVYWPQVAIMGISRSKMEPVYNGETFEPGMVLPLSLSYDHRIIDGAGAARFLRWVQEALEQPLLLVFE